MIGLEAGQAAFGDIYDWFRRFLSYGGTAVSLANLEKEAAALPPDACRVTALDWHNGRRSPDSDPLLTGAVFNLTLGTSPAMFYRALIESTVFGAKRIIERLQQYQVPIERIAAIGGISQKSPFIMQLCADVFQIPVRVIHCDQACAMGGAIAAATAAGLFPDLAHAIQAMAPRNGITYYPNRQLTEQYIQRYQEYLRLGGIWEETLHSS